MTYEYLGTYLFNRNQQIAVANNLTRNDLLKYTTIENTNNRTDKCLPSADLLAHEEEKGTST